MTKAISVHTPLSAESEPQPRPANRFVWPAGAVLGILVVWFGSDLGLWFAPVVVGLLAGIGTGLRRNRWPAAYGLAALVAVVGWVLPLGLRAVAGQPVMGAANTTADLAGFAGAGSVVLAATVIVALLQSVVGTWLGRAVTCWLVRPTTSSE
ncbi:MAG TPA: hypothetical protein VGM75_14295 [Pseudonocardiaceae bacterium]|jgi:hypothetical protein